MLTYRQCFVLSVFTISATICGTRVLNCDSWNNKSNCRRTCSVGEWEREWIGYGNGNGIEPRLWHVHWVRSIYARATPTPFTRLCDI